jgi:hypothetical protein
MVEGPNRACVSDYRLHEKEKTERLEREREEEEKEEKGKGRYFSPEKHR